MNHDLRDSAGRLLGAGAFLFGLAAIVASWTPAPLPALAFWFGACLVGELMWVRLPLGGATLSMASAANFAALLVLPTGPAMLVAAVAVVIAEQFVVRKPIRRVLFNTGQIALTVGAASRAFQALAGSQPGALALTPALIPALIAAALTYFAANSITVSAAVAATEGRAVSEVWRANFGNRYEALSSGALFSLGALIAMQSGSGRLGAAVLALLPTAIAFLGYREYLRARAAAAEDEEKPTDEAA